MAGCDGGHSRRAGRGPRAGEPQCYSTVCVTGVFLQLLRKL